MNDRSKRQLNYETLDVELKLAQAQFVEWLCGDRPKDETQEQLAARLDVSPGTLSKWKKDVSFRRAWESRMRELHSDPDKIQDIMEVLFANIKSKGDVKSAELYMRLIDRMTPQKIEMSSKDQLASMSDEELAAALENVEFLKDHG